MPRYFFHVRDGAEILDHEGVALAGIAEARSQAVVAAGEMLKEWEGEFWKGEDWRMWVTDETGGALFALRFSAE